MLLRHSLAHGTAVARLLSVTRKHTVDNRNRPAQPEPGEDEAVEKPPRVREQGTRPTPVTNKKKR